MSALLFQFSLNHVPITQSFTIKCFTFVFHRLHLFPHQMAMMTQVILHVAIRGMQRMILFMLHLMMMIVQLIQAVVVALPVLIRMRMYDSFPISIFFIRNSAVSQYNNFFFLSNYSIREMNAANWQALKAPTFTQPIHSVTSHLR